MTTPTFTDRYVLAAGSIAREPERAEFERELRASIDDLVEARIGDGESPDAAERTVLEALGDPHRHASSLLGRQHQLIGPRYYFVWRRLLRMLLAIVWPIAVAAVVVAELIAEPTWGAVIGGTIGAAITIGVHLCFWPTAIFALLERMPSGDVDRSLVWTVDRLPTTAFAQRSIGAFVGVLIGAVVLLLLAAATVFVQVVGVVLTDAGWLPLFDPAANVTWVPLLVLTFAGQAALSVVVYLRGGWSIRTAIVNAALQALSVIAVLGLAVTGTMVSPQLVDLLRVPSVVPVIVSVATVAVVVSALFSAIGPFREVARRGPAQRD